MTRTFLKISFLIFCLNSIIVQSAIDTQIVVAVDTTIEYSSVALRKTDHTTAANLNLDNVITFKIKYYDATAESVVLTADNATNTKFLTSNAGAVSDYLYHYIRTSSTDTVAADPDRYTTYIGPPIANTDFTGKQFVQYYRPQYKTEAVSYPYVVYNLSETNITCATATRAPLLTVQAVFYCSDEEAKAAYDAAVAADAAGSVAWVNMSGTCDDNSSATFLIGGKLSAAARICAVLQGTSLCD